MLSWSAVGSPTWSVASGIALKNTEVSYSKIWGCFSTPKHLLVYGLAMCVCVCVYVCCVCMRMWCVYGWVPQQHCIHMHHRAAMNRFDELLKQVSASSGEDGAIFIIMLDATVWTYSGWSSYCLLWSSSLLECAGIVFTHSRAVFSCPIHPSFKHINSVLVAIYFGLSTTFQAWHKYCGWLQHPQCNSMHNFCTIIK